MMVQKLGGSIIIGLQNIFEGVKAVVKDIPEQVLHIFLVEPKVRNIACLATKRLVSLEICFHLHAGDFTSLFSLFLDTGRVPMLLCQMTVRRR